MQLWIGRYYLNSEKSFLIKWMGILFFQMLIIGNMAQAETPVYLTGKENLFIIDSANFQEWNPINKTASPATTKFFRNKNVKQSAWYVFKITNTTKTSLEWYLVSYNYSINLIDLVSISDGGQTEEFHFRDTTSIYNRIIKHKQPVFKIALKANETKTYYLRLKNESTYNYVFALYSHEKFLSHFFIEYIEFGIFYGFVFFAFIYSLIYYVLLREKVVLFYCLFVLSQLIFMLFRDGNGLFVVPSFPEYADLIKNISRGFLSVTMLLYTTYFLKIPTKGNLFKGIVVVIVLRMAYTFFMLNDTTEYTYHIEFFIILLCIYLSVRSYKENSDTRYMAVGLILLGISYLVYYESIIITRSYSSVGFFALYYGVAAECIFMTLALTERFKRLRIESFKQVQMNKDLEEMVGKRTEVIAEQNKLLEERSNELNLFLYSVSHDLKGPLKTIEGLCNIGEHDATTNHVEIFELIKRKLKNLESNISDLNVVTKLKNEALPKVQIHFDSIRAEMEDRFQFYEGYDSIQINYSNSLKRPYWADLFSIKCIYQNIFENALKYRDVNKKALISISISQDDNYLKIKIADNGVGISENVLPKIFNMFYRGNEKSRDDTGLGLFIVNLAVERLDGTISVESTEHIGTTFTIMLPFDPEK
ncbi:sensor histidine kinase [Cytophaga aurantiaca]|uniref:sensor histidine kinase n=1 Tax=Cytophaga aurantiaca TaxID=29530 RepID=UPI00036DB280|nr:sensor histidine kinase [Cytophaga aurantiaca]